MFMVFLSLRSFQILENQQVNHLENENAAKLEVSGKETVNLWKNNKLIHFQ